MEPLDTKAQSTTRISQATETTATSNPDPGTQSHSSYAPSRNEDHICHSEKGPQSKPHVEIQLTPPRQCVKTPGAASKPSPDKVSLLKDEDETPKKNENHSPSVIYLRLTAHEKTQLENEIFHWGYRGGGREEAEELSRHPDPYIAYASLSLFRRWSFTQAVRVALGSFLDGCMGDGSTRRKGGDEAADATGFCTANSEWKVVGSIPSSPPLVGASEEAEQTDEVLRMFRTLLDKRDESPLQHLPGDSRTQRVDALLTDEINKGIFEALASAVTNKGPMGKKYVVAPCPEEVPIWRLLAYQAGRNSRAWRCWPGVHSAACFMSDEWDVEYPYFATWDPAWRIDSGSEFSDEDGDQEEEEEDADEMSNDGSEKDSRVAAEYYSAGFQEESTTRPTDTIQTDGHTGRDGDEASTIYSANGVSESDIASSISLSFMSRRRRMREELDEEFYTADVWDVWILCQMVRCQEAICSFDQCPGTEHRFYLFEQLPVFKETWIRREIGATYEECGFLQRLLPDSGDSDDSEAEGEKYLSDLRNQWPLPIPRDFIEFADYSEYRFYEIDDKDVISSLLASAGLLDKVGGVDQDSHDKAQNSVLYIKWDLIYLDNTRRDPLRHDSDREHLHHTLYTSDDYIQWKYDKGVDHPGLCYPCDCIKLSPEQLEGRNKQDEEEHKGILEEGKQWTESEGAPRKGPPDPKYYAWKSRESRAKFKIEMRKNHGRWREYPDEHYEYGHAGGNVVFNRRRVEDVPEFVKGLDRFWVDWNDCMLIMGGREDEEGDPTDEDTIYILEALPGIKSRWDKMKKA
ncbi:hypothetical protein QBC37DRAFT_391832 [Rhypophila decipiens]|uniref:Uncharacterized protein n=1 Tax=Rhypophila decipiens TaxID=261697 RepID=A0AAN6Y203_9PEZI|nr:hypothetical protein QBC37DRAFT_391832 [Rhypophila decipiens]